MSGCTHDCRQGRDCTCARLMATVNMEHVTRQALGLRRWRLEYDCNGRPFVWAGEAANESAADSLARHHLTNDQADFRSSDAVLTTCVEQGT